MAHLKPLKTTHRFQGGRAALHVTHCSGYNCAIGIHAVCCYSVWLLLTTEYLYCCSVAIIFFLFDSSSETKIGCLFEAFAFFYNPTSVFLTAAAFLHFYTIGPPARVKLYFVILRMALLTANRSWLVLVLVAMFLMLVFCYASSLSCLSSAVMPSSSSAVSYSSSSI